MKRKEAWQIVNALCNATEPISPCELGCVSVRKIISIINTHIEDGGKIGIEPQDGERYKLVMYSPDEKDEP